MRGKQAKAIRRLAEVVAENNNLQSYVSYELIKYPAKQFTTLTGNIVEHVPIQFVLSPCMRKAYKALKRNFKQVMKKGGL